MKIGIVGSIDFGSHSGARTRATRVYSLLAEQYEVAFFNVNTVNTGPIPEGIEGYNLALRPSWLPLTGRELIAGSRALFTVETYDPDLIWAYNSFQHTPLIGYATARYLDVPLVVGVNDHRHGEGIKGHLLNNVIRRHVLRSANLLVYESETLERNVSQTGVTPARSIVVPTGVDIDQYYSPETVLSEDPTIFYVGRAKDIDLLLEATKLVRKQVPSVAVRLAGVSGVSYPEYTDTSYITFLGYVPEPQLHREMARSHVVTVPYRSAETAGRPVKLLEYMSAGKCIIATRLPFNTQMLRDGENAIITDPTPESFAEGLIRGLTDRRTRERLASTAREDVTEYSLERMRERLTEAVGIATKG
jgi:glycosyltransferase involved in cell wall biosynthesis